LSKISIIIVNWNGRKHLEPCLESIYHQTYPSYEVIMVDNDSRDDSIEFVTKRYPMVRIIKLDKNRGFAGGNIEGLNHAQGKYIALLNNDAVLTECWLEYMISAIESGESIGLCSSKIVIAGSHKIDSAGDCFTTAFNGTKVGEYDDDQNYSTRRYVQGACAAAVMYKRALLDQIGFYDDDFFFNHEDTDLNMRAWLAGWKCLFVPEAVVYHKVSASLGTLSDLSVYYFSRNTEWVWLKNMPLKLMLRYFPQRLIYEFASFGYFCILMRKYRPFLTGKFHAVLQLRKMLNKRRTIQKLVRLTERQIASELMPISKYIVLRLRNSQRANML
jgi:GT2 family glycosyltransferase